MASCSPSVRRRALLAVSAGVFCIQFEGFALNLALPQIGRDFQANGGAQQWAVSGYLLAAGTLMLGAGRLGDLFGRRRLLMIGMLAFGGASVLCAVAVSLPMLVAARVAQGAGGSLIMPVGLALLTNTYPVRKRGRAIGWALGMGGIATACGPLAGGMLTDAVSWRAVFWINVPLSMLGAAWAWRAPESYDTTVPPAVDWRGLATGSAALAALALLLDRGPPWGWLTGRSAVLGGMAVALLICFVRIEKSAANPLVALTLFRNGPYVVLTLAGAVVNTAMVVFLFVVPLSLQGQWTLPVMTAGGAFLMPAVAMSLAGLGAGRILPHAAVPAMTLCLGGGAAMLICLAASSSLTAYLAAAVLCAAVLGLGNALTLVATQAVVRAERAGEASGVTKTVITAAAGLGVALTGGVADQDGGAASSASAADHALLTAAGGCLAAGLALGLWAGTRRYRRRRERGPVATEGSAFRAEMSSGC